jgi:hypothetical protein
MDIDISTIYFSNVLPEHSGLYMCKVAIGAMYKVVTVEIIVKCKIFISIYNNTKCKSIFSLSLNK